MYKLFGFIVLLGLLGCQDNRLCVIGGTVSTDRYEGEFIYLVPVKDAKAERVDSCTIEQGAFRFEKPVDIDKLYILRTRPMLRLSLQELLVVVEPGQLTVRIDSVSSAGGTPLNDALQQWKEQKEKDDRASGVLHQMLRADGDSIEILQRMNQLKAATTAYHFNFIKQNRGNVLGAFIYTLTAGSFTPEQQQELQLPE